MKNNLLLDVDEMAMNSEASDFFVSASFVWERRAISYAFDYRSGQGRDTFALIPVSVASVDAWDAVTDEKVSDSATLARLGALALSAFLDSGIRKDVSFGSWV